MRDSNPDIRVAEHFRKGHLTNSIVLITAEYGKFGWPIKEFSLRRSILGHDDAFMFVSEDYYRDERQL